KVVQGAYVVVGIQAVGCDLGEQGKRPACRASSSSKHAITRTALSAPSSIADSRSSKSFMCCSGTAGSACPQGGNTMEIMRRITALLVAAATSLTLGVFGAGT